VIRKKDDGKPMIHEWPSGAPKRVFGMLDNGKEVKVTLIEQVTFRSGP